MRPWLLVAASTLAPGCIPSNVVATDQRLVATGIDQLQFAHADVVALEGLHASVDIRGDAALSLRAIWYWFRADGTYTAAALTEVDTVSFQTRDGTWRCDPGSLVLDDGEPVLLEVAGDHYRLSSPAGSVVLRRERGR